MQREYEVRFFVNRRALKPCLRSLIFARSYGEAQRQARLSMEALSYRWFQLVEA